MLLNLPFDLHVLGLPLAFILSQDQTLRCNNPMIPLLPGTRSVAFTPLLAGSNSPTQFLFVLNPYSNSRLKNCRNVSLRLLSTKLTLYRVESCGSAINYQSFKERFAFQSFAAPSNNDDLNAFKPSNHLLSSFAASRLRAGLPTFRLLSDLGVQR